MASSETHVPRFAGANSLADAFDLLAASHPRRVSVSGVGARNGRPAQISDYTVLTWEELRLASLAVAGKVQHELQTNGVSTDLIGIMSIRSTLWLAATVGVSRCGIPFVWLGAGELSVPKADAEISRNANIMRTLRPGLVLVGPDVSEHILCAYRQVGHQAHELAIGPEVFLNTTPLPTILDSHAQAPKMCYMLTGGSTGKSKVVEVTHAMALHELQTYPQIVTTLGADDRVLQQTPVLWAATTLGQLNIALAFGATLCLGSDAVQETIRDLQVSVLGIVPSALGALEPNGVPSVRCVFTWGEALNANVASRWRRNGILLCDLLISTEYWLSFACDGATSNRGRSIYKAVGGVDFAVLPVGSNALLKEVGSTGELCLRGPMVTTGYRSGNDVDQTFVPSADGGLPYYRSKDLVTLVQDFDGTVCVEFYGRIDNLVKVAGQFVDLEQAKLSLKETLCGDLHQGICQDVAVLPGRASLTELQGNPAAAHVFMALQEKLTKIPGGFDAILTARSAIPRGASLHPVVAPLPKNHLNGKIDGQILLDGLEGQSPALPAWPVLKQRLIPYIRWLLVSILIGGVDLPTVVRLPASFLGLCRKPRIHLGRALMHTGAHCLVAPYLWLVSLYMPKDLMKIVTDFVPFGRFGCMLALYHLSRRSRPRNKVGLAMFAAARMAKAVLAVSTLAGLGLAIARQRSISWCVCFWLSIPDQADGECRWWMKLSNLLRCADRLLDSRNFCPSIPDQADGECRWWIKPSNSWSMLPGRLLNAASLAPGKFRDIGCKFRSGGGVDVSMPAWSLEEFAKLHPKKVSEPFKPEWEKIWQDIANETPVKDGSSQRKVNKDEETTESPEVVQSVGDQGECDQLQVLTQNEDNQLQRPAQTENDQRPSQSENDQRSAQSENDQRPAQSEDQGPAESEYDRGTAKNGDDQDPAQNEDLQRPVEGKGDQGPAQSKGDKGPTEGEDDHEAIAKDGKVINDKESTDNMTIENRIIADIICHRDATDENVCISVEGQGNENQISAVSCTVGCSPGDEADITTATVSPSSCNTDERGKTCSAVENVGAEDCAESDGQNDGALSTVDAISVKTDFVTALQSEDSVGPALSEDDQRPAQSEDRLGLAQSDHDRQEVVQEFAQSEGVQEFTQNEDDQRSVQNESDQRPVQSENDQRPAQNEEHGSAECEDDRGTVKNGDDQDPAQNEDVQGPVESQGDQEPAQREDDNGPAEGEDHGSENLASITPLVKNHLQCSNSISPDAPQKLASENKLCPVPPAGIETQPKKCVCCDCGQVLSNDIPWRSENGQHFCKPCHKKYDNKWWDDDTRDVIRQGVRAEDFFSAVDLPDSADVDDVASDSISFVGQRLLQLLVPAFDGRYPRLSASLAGVDSLAVLTLCRSLRVAVPGLPLRPQDVFDCRTVGELITTVEEKAAKLERSSPMEQQDPNCWVDIGKDETSPRWRLWFAPAQYTGTCKWLYGCRGLLDEVSFREAARRLVARHEGLHSEFEDGQDVGLNLLRFLKESATLLVAMRPECRRKQQDLPRWAAKPLGSMASIVDQCASRSFRHSWPATVRMPITEKFLAKRIRVYRCTSWNEVTEASKRLRNSFEPPLVMGLFLLDSALHRQGRNWGETAPEAYTNRESEELPHGMKGPRSFVQFVVSHAFSDGYTGVPLIHDFANIYADVEKAREGHAVSSHCGLLRFGASFDVLQERFLASLDGQPKWSHPDQLSLRPTCFDRPSFRTPWVYNHEVLVENEAVTSLQMCAKAYGLPFDVVLLSVVLAATVRAKRNRSASDDGTVSLPLTLYAPMRDGDQNDVMVGLFSDWRDITVACAANSTLFGLCLGIAETIRNRRWTVFDPFQNSERILVNILPLDEQPRGALNFRQTRAHEYGDRRTSPGRERGCWRGQHRPMRLTLEQEAPDAWWISLDLNHSHFNTTWCRSFVPQLRDCIDELARTPLIPLLR